MWNHPWLHFFPRPLIQSTGLYPPPASFLHSLWLPNHLGNGHVCRCSRLSGLTLVQRTLTATFHKAVASDPGCTSNSRCFGCPVASLAVLIEERERERTQSTQQSIVHCLNANCKQCEMDTLTHADTQRKDNFQNFKMKKPKMLFLSCVQSTAKGAVSFNIVSFSKNHSNFNKVILPHWKQGC